LIVDKKIFIFLDQFKNNKWTIKKKTWMLLKFSVKLSDKGGGNQCFKVWKGFGYFDLGIHSAPMFFRIWFKRKTNKTFLDTS